MDSSLSDNFQERLTSFLNTVNTALEKSKVPAWFSPMMEAVKLFACDVAETFAEIHKKSIELESRLAIQKIVTDALDTDRVRVLVNIQRLEVELEDQKQYTRRNMVLIHGVEETEGRENTDDIAIKVFSEIDVPITKSLINRSHRLGRKSNSHEGRAKRRPIIVSFTSYEQKKSVYDNKKKLKGKKTVITESLTKNRYALLQQCIQSYGKNNVWTYDGRIYCVNNEEKFCVSTVEELLEQRD